MTLIVLALAVFRITRLLVVDSISDPIRDLASRWWFTDEMFACEWCLGWWVSLIATVVLYFSGYELPFIVWLALPWAFSAVTGLLSR